MMRTFAAGALLVLAVLAPVQQAAAQNRRAGAIVGGALGRGPGGAIADAVIGEQRARPSRRKTQRRAGSYY